MLVDWFIENLLCELGDGCNYSSLDFFVYVSSVVNFLYLDTILMLFLTIEGSSFSWSFCSLNIFYGIWNELIFNKNILNLKVVILYPM